MTVCRLFESIKLPTEFDATSITNAYNGEPIEAICNNFTPFLAGWFNRHGRGIKKNFELQHLSPNELSYRFKSGPMGPSILTSHLDAHAIESNDLYAQIFGNYLAYSEATEEFMFSYKHTLDTCYLDPELNNLKKDLIVGRIALASEPAGKTREFAICNF